MRKIPISVVSALVAVALLIPTSTAAAEGTPVSARERLRQLYWQRHVEQVWRGQHPGAAVSLPGTHAAPTVWTTVLHTQQISSDNSIPRSNSEPDTQAEPYIAIDPNDQNHVVAVFQQGRFPDGGSVAPGYATSQDGGKTWVTDKFHGVTIENGGQWDRASDPWVAFGPDGAVYAVLIAFDDTCPNGITVIRSDDGGITWNTPVDAVSDTSCAIFNDKESIGVDVYPDSPHFGRVYVAWDRLEVGQPIKVVYSDDRGQTWSGIKAVSGTVDGIGANVLVQPNGDVSIVYINLETNFEVIQTSSDGGDTWGPIVNIALDKATSPPDQRVNCDLAAFAIDPVTGVLYVGWCDSRARSDGLNDELVWRSTDGGATWTGPVKVNHDHNRSGIDHLSLGLAANNHVVHAFYLIRRFHGGVFSDFVNQRYSHSSNNGSTYTDEIVIGPRTDLNFAAQAGGLFLGDYIGIAASGTRAHPVWCRASDPGFPTTYHQATWSATIGK
jgi:hypothetical protein